MSGFPKRLWIKTGHPPSPPLQPKASVICMSFKVITITQPLMQSSAVAFKNSTRSVIKISSCRAVRFPACSQGLDGIPAVLYKLDGWDSPNRSGFNRFCSSPLHKRKGVEKKAGTIHVPVKPAGEKVLSCLQQKFPYSRCRTLVTTFLARP